MSLDHPRPDLLSFEILYRRDFARNLIEYWYLLNDLTRDEVYVINLHGFTPRYVLC